MKPSALPKAAWRVCLLLTLASDTPPHLAAAVATAESALPAATNAVRIAAAQPRRRSIDWRINELAEVLRRVEQSLGELEEIIHRAGAEKCDALAFPEDTLGLGEWEAAHPAQLKGVLPSAVDRMLERLGRVAASHRMYLVLCNDLFGADGAVRNTAFFLDRDGKELGRYHKVNMPIHELDKKRGESFPVFNTPDLGGVGMLICYDMVFPEAPRCLALAGADIVFHPTLGGAAISDGDISLAAFRTRAVENFVYLVVAQRGSGSMIISPQGNILAEAKGADSLATADIDPLGGREGGDAFNYRRDMRARLFRERSPAAFSILVDTNPPALAKVPETISVAEAVRISAKAFTVGEDEFKATAALARDSKTAEANAAFQRLTNEYRGTWIDRVSRQQLAKLEPPRDGPAPSGVARSLSADYPGDIGIEKDPRVVFAENFEEPSFDSLKPRWDTVSGAENMAFSEDVPPGSGGKHSLQMTHVGGKGTGAQLYRRLLPGCHQLHARFYVKFDPDCAPLHHFGTGLGGYNPATPWPQGGAGERPAGDKSLLVDIEPYGASWTWDYYTYWCEMRGSPPRGQTWGNSFIRDPQLKVARGQWICVEMMLKMNDVGQSNGELALWIDGKRVSHLGPGFPKGKWVYDKFIPGGDGEGVRWNDAKVGPENFQVPPGGQPFEGFRWRTADELKLNFLWLHVYITKASAGHVSRVWFDDAVVATEYIGPIQPRRCPAGSPPDFTPRPAEAPNWTPRLPTGENEAHPRPNSTDETI